MFGNSLQECIEKDKSRLYKSLENIERFNGFPQENSSVKKTTQDFLFTYFGGKPQLTNLHIEITSKCNERCVHCYIPHENKYNHIEPGLFYNILEQCRDLKLLHLTLSGGEPMLHMNFCDFLKRCNEYNFSVNVLSNLTLLNDEIVNEFKNNPLLGVQVSLYSMNPLIHDGITKSKGSFKKTKSAIIKLIESDIPVQISCPILKQNVNSYEEVIQWAKDNNIQVGDDYNIIARYDHSTQNLNSRLSLSEIREVTYRKILSNPKYLDNMRGEVKKRRKRKVNDFVCSVGHSSLCIAENGNVYPCAGWQSYVLGNINEDSLNHIWTNSEKLISLRGLRNLDFPKCIKCPSKDYCTMCLVRNSNESLVGNPLEVNEYFCEVANLNREIMLEIK